RAGGARLVDDTDRRLEDLLQRRGHRPRSQVGNAAGRERRHQRDGPRRIALLSTGDAGHHGQRHDADEDAGTPHSSSPFSAIAIRSRQSKPCVMSDLKLSRTRRTPTASKVVAIGRVRKIAYCPSDIASDWRSAISIMGARITPSTIGAGSNSSLRSRQPTSPITSMIQTSTTLELTA